MLLATSTPAEELLAALLDVSVSGVVSYLPVLDAAGQPIDFAFAYLNPVAQRLLGLPARPAATYRQQFAESEEAFAFHRAAYLAGGEPCYLATNYQVAPYDAYFRIGARRVGELLLVSFTTSDEQDRQQVEQTLRASQARERAARAEAEAERQRLADFILQVPAPVVAFAGSAHTFVLANPSYQALVGERPLLGQPLREAVPEIVQQQLLLALLDHVYQTGETYYGYEVEARSDRHNTGALTTAYFNLVHQATRDQRGGITGVISFAYDVTEQVLARRQAEQLNHELEARVQARTRELLEQRQQLGQILAQVPAAIATLEGPEHRFTFANGIYRTIVSDRATVGQSVAEAQPELVGQGFIDLLDRVYTTGEPYLGREIPVQLHDAATGHEQTHYIDFSYQPLRSKQGNITGILTFAVDETEKVLARRQAETLLAELLAAAQRQVQERQNVYQLFEQLPAAIVLLREPNHRIEYYNPAFTELFPPRQWAGPLRGNPIAEVYPQVELARLVTLLDRVYRTGNSEIITEMPLAGLQSGSQRYITFAYQAYREQGQVAGVAAFMYDMTEEVRTRRQTETMQTKLLAAAQRQAQEREELYQVFEQAPAAILLLREPGHRIEYVNPAYQQFFPGQALQGYRLAEAHPAAEATGVLARLNHVYQTGETYVGQEEPVLLSLEQGQPPQTRYFDFTYQPYRDNGQTVGVSIFATDATEQALARQQVQRLNAELATINRTLELTNAELHQSNAYLTRTNVDLDTFVYTASHDLRAPITNIEGLLTALREVLPTEVQAEATTAHILRLLQDSVERFQLTIEQLTDISRLQQAQNLPAERVPLAPVVADVRLDLLPLLTAAGAQLTVAIDPDCQVLFAPKNLRSVVYNLLSNALKYRAPDRVPIIALRATCLSGEMTLAVQDNGLGMSEAQQRLLFGLFQRLHTHVEGSGVGLYMVKRMVENAGGTITVQSQEGVGTTFTITLGLG